MTLILATCAELFRRVYDSSSTRGDQLAAAEAPRWAGAKALAGRVAGQRLTLQRPVHEQTTRGRALSAGR